MPEKLNLIKLAFDREQNIYILGCRGGVQFSK